MRTFEHYCDQAAYFALGLLVVVAAAFTIPPKSTLRIHNLNWADAKVYVQPSGRRVATVGFQERKVVRLRRRGTEYQLQVVLRANAGEWWSRRLVVGSPECVELVVQSAVSQSYVGGC